MPDEGAGELFQKKRTAQEKHDSRLRGSNPRSGTMLTGALAQSGERLPCKQEVVGAEPTCSTS